MKIEFAAPGSATGSLALPVFADAEFSPAAAAADTAAGGALRRAIERGSPAEIYREANA